MADTTCRVQRLRVKGWAMPENTVYVGRPTLWGNLFIHPSPAEAVSAYRRLISGGTQPFAMGPGALQYAPNAHPKCAHWAWSDWAREKMPSLRGRNLACWCPLDQPCHADVLLEMANG